MDVRHVLTAAGFAAMLGGLVLPALAQARDRAGDARDPAVSGTETPSRMDHDMMSRGGMSRGTMGGGCAGMMQSMNGGDGRPNSQWRSRLHGSTMSE
jgi:hypothetical protein